VLAVAGVRDVVPTFRSVAVSFDPLHTHLQRLIEVVTRLASTVTATAPLAAKTIRIPVWYGRQFGPDLAEVARMAALDEPEVIARHTAVTYRVFMLGFLPGFAYLGTVDPRIAAPRRTTPRTRVPAGSIGIAGGQTGIYPLDTPGGWQIIGRTLTRPFDLTRAEPFLFRAGDAVLFYAVDPS
jgi:inhibitor of KinA